MLLISGCTIDDFFRVVEDVDEDDDPVGGLFCGAPVVHVVCL